MIRTDHAKRPPFEGHPQTVSNELLKMVDAGIRHFHMGHGGPLPAEEVRRHAQRLQELK